MKKELPVPFIDHPMSGRIGFVNNNNSGQTPLALLEFKNILQEFDTIIEIGYHRGGTTEWFYENKNDSATLISFDITDSHRTNGNPNIDFRIRDCFGNGFNEITELIQSKSRVILFCDGGNKIREFNTFAPFLKPDDVILVHDYWDDTQEQEYNTFEESEGWIYGYECKFTDIQHTIEANNLIGFNYEPFRRVLIGSFIKESM